MSERIPAQSSMESLPASVSGAQGIHSPGPQRVPGASQPWAAAGESALQVPEDTALSLDATDVSRRAWAVLEEASERSAELMADLEGSASTAGWKVARAGSPEEAAAYVRSVGVDVEARTAVRSAHDILARMEIDEALDGAGIASLTR